MSTKLAKIKTKAKQKKIELLAPAKNRDIAIAAINYGADAVYIGASNFSARKNAGNSIADIESAIKYAHLYDAKVYVALNTLLKDNEIEDAQRLIAQIYEAGADALIIQDMGLLELDLPPLELHASTQAHNISLDKIKFLKDVGFSRVILPREFSLSRIQKIAESADIDLECFIHGALCVSYSGQCYMSEAIGGRSANRGECAQPCRKKYTLIDENKRLVAKNQHLLSLKDLNLSENVESLAKAGVSSFKIEGRLKDESYVKNVVGFYRQKIDSLSRNTSYVKSSSGMVFFDFEPNLNKTFNREYCEYFLNERSNDISQFRTSKSLGEKLGKISSVKKNSFKLDSDVILSSGDGICFFDEAGELKGTQINAFENSIAFAQNMKGIEVGVVIYRNHDQEFLKKLKNSKTQRKLQLGFDVSSLENTLIFKAIDEVGVTVSVDVADEFEQAKNPDKAKENIKKQLSKLGESIFLAKDVCVCENAPFIPVSRLNDIRRELVQKLIEKKLASYQRNESKILPNNISYPQNELLYNSNIINQKAKAFYERHGAEVMEMLDGDEGQNRKIIRNNAAMTTKHCLRYSFGQCAKKTKNSQSWQLIDDRGYKYELQFDCKNCEMKVIY